jgi:sugar phosphate isomerase/epimerase
MWAIGFASGGKEARPASPMDAIGLLRRAHELGVHAVQYGPNLDLAALPEAELDRLLAQARTWDIELELGTRGLETEHLIRQLALARRAGARLLRTVPEIGGQTPSLPDIPGYLRAILPWLEKDGVKLGLENGKIPALDLKWALDKTGSSLVGVVLDTANSLAVAEGWRYVTETLAPFTVCLHHKDFRVQRVWHMMGFTVEGRPAGQGQLDTPWLLETLQRAGAQFNVILEVWPPEQATLEATIALEESWASESIQYLRQYIRD